MNRAAVPVAKSPWPIVGTLAVCVVLPAILYIGVIVSFAKAAPVGSYHALDFHSPWTAAQAVADGRNPYVKPTDLVPSGARQSFVYPAPTAFLLIPFGLLPYRVASLVFVTLLALSVAGALRLFGVRDWRCYGITFASPAVMTAISIGTLTPLLLLGLAAAWRWRNRTLIAALAVAATALLKVFLWPLVTWLWFTGRRRAAVGAVAIDVAACAASWGWISFGGLTSYPALLHRLEEAVGPTSYAPLRLLGSTTVGAVTLAGLAAIAVAVIASRSTRDKTPFAAAVLVALLASPVLWLHYLALLAAVAAVARPRLHFGWVLPLALWTTPFQVAGGTSWRIGVALAVTLAVSFVSLDQTASLRRRMSRLALAGSE